MISTLRIALASVAVCLSAPALAQETVRGSLFVCDTRQQAERLGEVFTGKAPEALLVVNTEAKNPVACVAVNAAFMPGRTLNTVRSKTHTFHVIPVIVLGVNTPAGLRPVAPKVFFTIRAVKEYSI
jgi:hypothetical protein